MVRQDRTETLVEGNIVEILNAADPNLNGCRGEVITVEPLTIAVLHVLPFLPAEVKKIFDSSNWSEVCKEAKSLDIKIKGTKEDLVSKVNESHLRLGRAEIAAVDEAVPPTALRQRGVGLEMNAAPVALTSAAIEIGDFVNILALLAKPNGRVCNIQTDIEPVKYTVVFFNPKKQKREGKYRSTQLVKLSPPQIDVPECS